MDQLICLGYPTLFIDGSPVRLETRKMSALLVYLRLAETAVSRESLAALFWPEYDTVHAHANLRRVLSPLKKALGEARLQIDRETIGFFDPADLKLDVAEFRRCAALGLGPQEDLTHLEEAARLYRGDFLEGFNLADSPAFDEWQFIERENLRRELARVLQKTAELWSERGEWEKALGAARRLVTLDPLDETAQRRLIGLYAHSDQRPAALRQYEELSRCLLQELGQTPDAETEALMLQIRQGRQAASPNFERKTKISAPLPVPPESAPVSTGFAGDLLLKTKLHLPQPRANQVPRPRLLDRLDEIVSRALLLISAPAGFGKTSLVAEWAARQRLRLAWVALDSGENAPISFLTYVLGALEQLFPGVSGRAGALLKASQPCEPLVIVTALLKQLESIQEPFGLVLEDYHLISNPAVHELTAVLLERRLPGMHLILITRVDPPLPVARLRSQNQLLEIRAADLRFNQAEAAAFLNQGMGLRLTVEDIFCLTERTEGWVVGLQMAGLSLLDHPASKEFIQAFSGSHRYVLDYLVEEVLSRQPEPVQRFLMETSILERLTAPLCYALTGRTDAQALLEWLEKNNLFLVPLDEQRIWFRYHHLFADLLRARLEQAFAGEISSLYSRASAWYEGQGLLVEAVQAAFAAGDMARVNGLIEQNMVRFALNWQVVTLVGWINLLPEDQILANPWFCILVACDLIVRGKVGDSERLMDQAEAWFLLEGIDESNEDRLGYVASLRANIAEIQNDAGRTIEEAQRAITWLGTRHLLMSGSARYLLGRTYQKMGNFAQARVELNLLLSENQKNRLYYYTATSYSLLASMDRFEGHLRQAERLLREGVELIRRFGSQRFFGSGIVYNSLGDVCREHNRLEEASQLIGEGLWQSRSWGNLNMILQGLTFLGRVRLAQKDWAALNEILAEGDALCGEFPPSLDSLHVWHALKVRYALAVGQVAEAEERDRLFRATLSNEPGLWQEYASIITGRLRLAAGQPQAAAEILKIGAEKMEAAGRLGWLLEASNVLALAEERLGNHPEAQRWLRKSLLIAGEEGFLRSFLDEGAPMQSLLRELTALGESSAARILAEFEPVGGK